jgi:hypothetical protein
MKRRLWQVSNSRTIAESVPGDSKGVPKTLIFRNYSGSRKSESKSQNEDAGDEIGGLGGVEIYSLAILNSDS